MRQYFRTPCRRQPGSNASHANRGGFVLLVVTIVVILLSLAAYSYMSLMETEQRAAGMFGREVEARREAERGFE